MIVVQLITVVVGSIRSCTNSTGIVCCVEGGTHGCGTPQMERRLFGNV